MHPLGRYNFFCVFAFFVCFTFAENRCADPIQYIKGEREKIWGQLVELVQSEDCTDGEKSVELISYKGKKIAVSQAFVRKVLSLDSFGRLKRTDEKYRGHHPVVRLKNLFFKSDVCLPHLDPMLETAVFFFHGLLFRKGVVPGDFVFVKNVQMLRFPVGPWDAREIQQVLLEQEEKFVQDNPSYQANLHYEVQNHLLQISQAIEGERFNSFIALVDEGKRTLDELEEQNFQQHVFTDILLNSGDHKGENFILEDNSPKRSLVNVDNDGMFYHTKVERTPRETFAEIQPFGGCKNLLFVLKPLMDRPLVPALRQRIEELDVDSFLWCWLSLLDETNQQIIKTLQADPSFSKRYENNFLPLKFSEKTVARLRSDMCVVKRYVKTHPNCSSSDLFHLLRPDVADYYSWLLHLHPTYTKAFGSLYGNERPLALGRVPGARIGSKSLKGRWIFQAIERYKKLRTLDLKDSMQEMAIPVQDRPAVTEPVLGPSNMGEILLRNSDDLLWREWVSEDVLYAFCYNELPEKMRTVYPYKFLQEQILLLHERSPNMAKDIVFKELKEFCLTQKTYEDYIYFLFEDGSKEGFLPTGVKKCTASLQTNEADCMRIDFRTPEAKDGSIKYRFRTHDNQWIEALYFPYNNGLKVLCLSTQIGCDMACYFCCTGKQKRVRNLTQEEIVRQATLILDDLMPGTRPDTITLAGMGEPLANYDASIGALKQFREMFGNIRLSLSTVGLKEGIKRMIQEKCNFGLYLSLHSSDEDTRKRLMPAALRNPLPELMALVEEYARMNPPGTVRISYLLLKGVTDTQEQLHKLINLCKNSRFQVQFRIWNCVDSIDLEGTSLSVAEEWVARLQAEGINACVRPSVGQEVQGACGQIHYSSHNQKIVPISSFLEAEKFIDSVDQKTLVVFDIDSTLIVPEDPHLHPKAFSTYKDVIRKVFASISEDQKHFLNHSIIAQDAMIVEPSSIELIRKLQAKRIPMIAMTAAKQGRFDDGDRSFHEIRAAQLKKIGIDFSKNAFEDRKFSTLQDTYGDFPCLIQGISYSCGLHNSKGSVLEAFLKEVPEIERVILFDDKRKHLDSCAVMVKEKFPEKEFLGFHYKGADLLTPEVLVSEEEFEEYLLAMTEKVKQIEWVHG